jgi:hypothetical protein
MMTFNEIAKYNYDFIMEYILAIGTFTMSLMDTDQETAAQLAIEIWSTIAEVEFTR